MASQIQQGDIGTKLLVTVTDAGTVVDISSAIALEIFLKKPDGTILSRSGTLDSDGTDGKMFYIIVAGDVDVAGHYKLQGKVTLSSGSFFTSTTTFKVHCNL
tara:strand:+ start:188 stop:493 length:306 start_codon:yes stop_codon:yes gene_type:complete